MTIKVKLFAVLRESAGAAEVLLQIPDQKSVADVLQQLTCQYPQIAKHLPQSAIAVNMQYVRRDHPLSDGDELALLPPVSGG